MPSLADWSRADIIAALALMVSVLAFVASTVSSLVSWRTYVATQTARAPKLRVYFEPFVGTDRWWIANFGIRNRSDHTLRFESIKIVRPLGAVFSAWLGGFAGQGSGSGPMHYDLPEEALTTPRVRELTNVEEDEMDLEIEPSNEPVPFATLIVGTPRWRLCSDVRFQIRMLELGETHRIVVFRVSAPFPTKENTKPRF